MALPAFKNGKPLFKNGRPCFGCGTCGGCACASISGTACTVCPTSCTPRHAEAVVSGVGTSCVALSSNISQDASGATLAGTFTAEHFTAGVACRWTFRESPGSTFNFRHYVGVGTPSNNCSVTPTTNQPWKIDITVRDPGGGATRKVRAALQTDEGGGVNALWFDGEVDMPTDCAGGAITINNGDGGKTHVGTGGTITVHFCP